MSELLQNIDILINNLLESLGMYGPILGSILILFESILPILPLSVFITINFYTFGNAIGFLISYVLTIVGCNIAFYISKRVLSNRMDYLLKKYDKNKFLRLVKNFSNIKMHHLVVLMAFPFTPAFLVNIVSGVSEMSQTKFAVASVIAKPFMIYFWGYIGVTLLQSLTHPEYILRIIVMLLIAYIISIIINKKFNIK